MHTSTWSPRELPPSKENSCSVEEPGEYEVIKDDTKLKYCGSVKVKMRNGEGMYYVKDGEVGWTPIVRRKKSARREESDSSVNLNVMMDLNKARSLVWYRWKGFLEFMSWIINICKLRDGWQ